MKDIEIKGVKYKCPESYDEVSMEDYISYFKDLEFSGEMSYEEEIDNSVKLISNVLKISIDDVLELPITEIFDIRHSIGFLQDKLVEDSKGFVILDGEIYNIPEPEKISYRQMIDAESVVTSNESRENFIKLASYLLVKDGEKYDACKVQDIENKIRKAKVKDIVPFVLDFIKKKTSYVKDIQTYSQKLEELKNTLQNIQTLKDSIQQ